MSVVILDGYLDEPSSLGVPPFISPLVRYVAGACSLALEDPVYVTIDAYRDSVKARTMVRDAGLLVIIAGTSVPGTYIRGTPMSMKEVVTTVSGARGRCLIGGPMVRRLDQSIHKRGRVTVLEGDADAALHDLLTKGEAEARNRTREEWGAWSEEGARIVEQHPDHPRPLMAEVDVYKGCPRFHTGGCSFCSEILQGPPRYRKPEEVAAEVEALSSSGVVNFRLACSCIVSYDPDRVEGEEPRPSPSGIRALLGGIREVAPDLEVLHVDNGDPGTIARHIEASRKVLEDLVEFCTSGNLLSLGMESADPQVIEGNNLNSTPEEVMTAIRLINEVGGERGGNGMPGLLPGINFLTGLRGETARTYDMNLEFLEDVLEEGLLLRRINIRQVVDHRAEFPGVSDRGEFLRFKEAVREGIDRPMLRMMLPSGTVLRGLYMEERKGKLVFARQIGSYPILVGVPSPEDPEGLFDVVVVDWGRRSITALPHPFDLNRANMDQLSHIPGVGKKRAARLIRGRPYEVIGDLNDVMDDPEVVENITTVGTVARGRSLEDRKRDGVARRTEH